MRTSTVLKGPAQQGGSGGGGAGHRHTAKGSTGGRSEDTRSPQLHQAGKDSSAA